MIFIDKHELFARKIKLEKFYQRLNFILQNINEITSLKKRIIIGHYENSLDIKPTNISSIVFATSSTFFRKIAKQFSSLNSISKTFYYVTISIYYSTQFTPYSKGCLKSHVHSRPRYLVEIIAISLNLWLRASIQRGGTFRSLSENIPSWHLH